MGFKTFWVSKTLKSRIRKALFHVFCAIILRLTYASLVSLLEMIIWWLLYAYDYAMLGKKRIDSTYLNRFLHHQEYLLSLCLTGRLQAL